MTSEEIKQTPWNERLFLTWFKEIAYQLAVMNETRHEKQFVWMNRENPSSFMASAPQQRKNPNADK